MSLFRNGHLLGLLALAPLLSCHCNTKIRSTNACSGEANVDPTNQGTCGSNADCSDHYQCTVPKDNPALQCCVNEPRSCNTDADCCPGQQCNTEAKECFDKFLDCSQGGNAACGNPDGGGDFVCTTWTDNYGTSQRCVLQPCSATGTCPEDSQSCFQGQCLSTLPCGGSCPSGDGCVPEVGAAGWCQKWACPVTCAAGYIATFKDDIHIWDTCNLPAESCSCVELPPLRSNDLGRFSALAPTPGTAGGVLVSQYDGQYGDLVVNHYDGTGKLLSQQYVDGVPDSGTVVYGPDGPRGGIVDPGTDVGRYSDIAVNGQLAYVSYYDFTNGALKLAILQADGHTWNTMQVDGVTANVGLYSAVAVDANGNPGIAYFQLGGNAGYSPSAQCSTQAGGAAKAFITALKFARATKANPQSAADFNVSTLACLGRTAPACYQCAGVCADPGTGPSCYTAATGCSGCDPNTQACVTVGSTPTCANKYNPSTLAQTPDGTGVFSRLAFQGTTAYIAYQQRKSGAGVLYGVSLDGSNNPSTPVLLDGADDTGYFPDVKIDPTSHNVLVSYMDWATKSLKLYQGTGLQAGVTPQIIDTGAGPAGSGIQAYVGSSSSIAFASTGDVYVAYQDTTNNNLNLAVRKTSWTVLPPIATNGAVGFFASGAFVGSQLFVSSGRLHATSVAGAPTLDNTLVLTTFTPP